MERSASIKIAVSSDIQGFPRNATVIAAILRRTKSPVCIRFCTRGFLPESFTFGLLTVEFHRAATIYPGNFPSHVSSAVFDRLEVIPHALDWDRCLIMDHDQLALCDLAPYFDEDFEGNLLMGRLFGPRNTLGLQMAGRGGLPEKLRHAENYPYFYMGPMMNLRAMRKERTWPKLLKAHAILRQEEQLALTVATGGKVKAVGRKWNLVPHWDNLARGPMGPESSQFGTVGEAAPWLNGLPEGVIHWTGRAKPWHHQTRVWRADLWESEETSWEALRRGWWEKPRAVEIGPRTEDDAVHLSRRGWKVDVVSDPAAGHAKKALPFPDLHWIDFPTAKKRGQELLEGASMVRFGPGAGALPWLKTSSQPQCVVVQGPLTAAAAKRLVRLGYSRLCRILRKEWPGGGPAPAALEFNSPDGASLACAEGEDLYLRHSETHESKR